MNDFNNLISFIRRIYKTESDFIPLHEPRFWGNEEKYVLEAIRSTFVSSVGRFVDRFEEMIKEITGAKYAVATVNGTTALHVSLLLAGVGRDDLVITQPLTFVATSNAIKYTGADPLFVDVDKDTLGLSPSKLKLFLEQHCAVKDGECIHLQTGKQIAACVPVHTFGFPARIDEIVEICNNYSIPVVEDAAESIYSFYKDRHTGTFGQMGVFSFNGNKIVTAGGGGAIVTNNEEIARKAKHLTTTAKVPHPYEYVHNEIAYNYRMPNLNAALICAQLEQLPSFVSAKRKQAQAYAAFFKDSSFTFITERAFSKANYWLMTILLNDPMQRDTFLKETNKSGVMTRPVWKLMHTLPMLSHCICGPLENAEWLAERVVNIPSSVIGN